MPQAQVAWPWLTGQGHPGGQQPLNQNWVFVVLAERATWEGGRTHVLVSPLPRHTFSCLCCGQTLPLLQHPQLRGVPACPCCCTFSCPLQLCCVPACPPQLLVVFFFSSSALLPSLAPQLSARWRTHIVVGMKLTGAMLSNTQRPAPMLAELPRGNPVSAALHTIMGLQVGGFAAALLGLGCTPS